MTHIWDATDCVVAFERASKNYLLTGQDRFLDDVEEIVRRLTADARGTGWPT